MFGASWRTKMLGLFAVITVLLGQVMTVLDDDPQTNPDVSLIIANISIGIAFFNTRDNKVTSRQAGAER